MKAINNGVSQSSGAPWKSRWPSWAPIPNKPTVFVDVKQHSTGTSSVHYMREALDWPFLQSRRRCATRKLPQAVPSQSDSHCGQQMPDLANTSKRPRHTHSVISCPAAEQPTGSSYLRSMLLYVHRDRTDYLGRGAQDVHLNFHTAPDR